TPPSSIKFKDEPSFFETHDQKPIHLPDRFVETISVRVSPGRRLGINIRKCDNRATLIDPTSPLFNKMCTGDIILKINNCSFHSSEWLQAVAPLSAPGNQGSRESDEEDKKEIIMKILVERAVFSFSRLENTTLERLDLNKSTLYTGRPLKRYTVLIRRPFLPGIELAPLGISLRYDSRERVTIASTVPGSVGSTHLRPWDIIKRVNKEPVNTKTMCAFMILRSLRETEQVVLTVEVLDGGPSSRDTMEMPADVVKICADHIAALKAGRIKSAPPITVVRPIAAAAAASSSSKKEAKSGKETK
ncbi:hypothetical protein PFISCL1PPCAC_8675, partial [Pristionchus fissidentatus]